MGVIDEFGQWENCNNCGEFVLIDNLIYEAPSLRHMHGRDLCPSCAQALGIPTA